MRDEKLRSFLEARCKWSGGGASAKPRHIRQGRSYAAGYQTNIKRSRKVCDDSRAGLNRAADLCLVREPATWLGFLALFSVLLAGATDAAASTSSGRKLARR